METSSPVEPYTLEEEAVVQKFVEEAVYCALFPEGAVEGDPPYLLGVFNYNNKRTQSSTTGGYQFELLEDLQRAYAYFWSLPDERSYHLIYSLRRDEQHTIPHLVKITGITIKDVSERICTMVLQLERLS